MEGSWGGIAGYVVGGCMLTEGCSWLAVVHGYEVSFIPTKCFIREKLRFDCYSAVFIMAFTACTKYCCVAML